LAPVLRGRSYIRQLAVEAKLHNKGTQAGGGLALYELRLSRETVGLINEVDLRNVTLSPGCQVIVYAQNPSPILSECTQAWDRRGVQVNCANFAGLEPMLRPAYMNHETQANVARIVEWLCQSVPGASARARALMPDPAKLRPTGCIETPLQFGTDSSLFGMLCRPLGRTEADLAVVIGNSSGDPHPGFARVTVDLSRRLATAGFASLRFDFAGLGDSVAPEDAASHIYETNRVADFQAAIDALERLGYRRFAIEGLCSGALHAFHAALVDARVGYLVLVNLPFFEYPTGTKIEYSNSLVENPMQAVQRVGLTEVWKRFLQGKLGMRHRLANQWVWLARKSMAEARQFAASLGFKVSSGFAWDRMMRLSERTRTRFVVAEGDSSAKVLADAFGINRVPRGSTVRVIPGLDHSVTSREMQRVVAEEIVSFLSANP